MYIVEGGEYQNIPPTLMKKGGYVKFGPFETYQDAYDCWKEKSWLNVDNALYRLEIHQTLGSY